MGRQRTPFLFLVDFEMNKPLVFAMENLDNESILFQCNGHTNAPRTHAGNTNRGVTLQKYPETFAHYQEKFNAVLQHLHYGDTFLTNLTTRTKILLSSTLREIFHISKAKYKLLYRDDFLVFSPETFVQIREGKIFSYPMKGTIDASVENAEQVILEDKKELAEHVTIVDLIRNDLSQVADNVQVSRFRFVDKLKTHDKELLQVSSEVTGHLSGDYWSRVGDILVKLLPAGSVSGAPKPKTLEIIRKTERVPRGYYTGIFGYFDGEKLDSGVLIRYIEKEGTDFFYRSGGGITTQSNVYAEYREIMDKVYVPVD